MDDQSSLDRDRNSSVDQEELELLQEEVNSTELRLKQETEDLQLCSAGENSSRSEDPTVDRNPEEPLQQSEVNDPVIMSVVSEACRDLPLHPGGSQSPELKGGNSKSTRRKRKDSNSNVHNSQRVKDPNVTVPKSRTSLTDDRRRRKSKCKSEVPKHPKSLDGEDQDVGVTPELPGGGSESQQESSHAAEKPHAC